MQPSAPGLKSGGCRRRQVNLARETNHQTEGGTMKGKMRTIYGLTVVFLPIILCSCASDIHYNAKTGNIAALQNILDSGNSIEKKDNLGNTPLIAAAFSNKPETVEYLCRKGANVNAQNHNRATALISAAFYNLIDVAKVLLKYNPNKTIKDKYGKTALDYAEEYKYTEMISLLK